MKDGLIDDRAVIIKCKGGDLAKGKNSSGGGKGVNGVKRFFSVVY